jgi:transcriptional regulator with XRE-family HTH domain
MKRLLGSPEDGWFFSAIADQVIEQRHARNLSQQELADLCGTTQSAIARFERGGRPPRVDTLLRMAEALDCELVVEFRPRTKTKAKGAKASLAMPLSGRAGSPARPSETTGRTNRPSKTPKGPR